MPSVLSVVQLDERGECTAMNSTMNKSWSYNELSGEIIGAAIEVHRELGPGLLEKVYEEALCHELRLRGIPFRRQVLVPVLYKGAELKAPCKCDLWVAGMIIVENKAASALTPIDDAQLLGYLKLMDQRLGLLINFNIKFLKQGVRRIVNGSLE